MRFIKEEKIATISFLYAILMVLLLVFTTGGLLIAQKYHALNDTLATLEEEFIKEQSETLRSDVTQELKRIDSQRNIIRAKLKKQLQNEVTEARDIADNIFRTMDGKWSKKEISRVIVEAIRPIRFHERQGYFFIYETTGRCMLFPVNPEKEGQNLLTNSSMGSAHILKKIFSIATKKGEGFHQYKWLMPGKNPSNLYEKVSFVTLFKPLNWIIGTGEYIDELEYLARKEITKKLTVKYKTTSNDYFFIYKINNMAGGEKFASMVINSNRPDLIGQFISDEYTDIKGKQFRKEFMEGIREKGTAMVTYWYKKPDGSGQGRKMSFYLHDPEWNWVLAKGIYLDRLDQEIAAKKADLKAKVKSDITLLFLIFAVAVPVAVIVAYFYANDLQAIFNRYKNTQKKHQEKLEKLNKALELKSNTDPLTQSYNRGYFNKHLNLEIARAIRYKSRLAIVFFDIDYFKSINDTYGHLTGDTVLKELVILVKSNIRTNDLLSRWGGEEFAILVPELTTEQTLEFAEKLRLIIARHKFSGELQITGSFGISSYIQLEESNQLLSRVDKALYKAKTNGRNRCELL